jgi:hypothetical protein
MKILLIDVDGKLPNLALMKLSTWHKAQGDEVCLNTCDKPDKVYISTLFSWNRSKVKKLMNVYSDANVGGIGWDTHKNLPNEIERSKPDYNLYTAKDIYERIKRGIGKKENKLKKAKIIVGSGIGYTSRGCIRENCGFCPIPEKEGKFHQVGSISELINPKSTVIILLDNNLTADPDVLDKLHEIRDRGLTVDITQGIDVRLMTPEIAQALSEVKHLRSIHYAWDLMKYEKQVLSGISILSEFVKSSKQLCMMLTGYNTSFEEDIYRFSELLNRNVDPYVMTYNKVYSDERHHHFARWVNGRIYKVCKFEDYEPWIKAQSNLQVSLF